MELQKNKNESSIIIIRRVRSILSREQNTNYVRIKKK